MRTFRRIAVLAIPLAALAALFVTGSFAGASSRHDASHAANATAIGVVGSGPGRYINLRHLKTQSSPVFPRSAFINRPTMSRAAYRAAKLARMPGGVRAGYTAKRSKQSVSPRALTVLGGFNGITQATAQSTWPPDSTGDVGGNRTAQVVNQHLTVWNKSFPPGAATSDRSFNTIVGNSSVSLFDPRILFDRTWQRWVAEVEAFPTSSTNQDFYLLTSTSFVPGGGYHVYDLNVAGLCGNSTQSPFWDYPNIGMTQDAIVVTANCFQGNSYVGARTFGVAKALLYGGLGFSVPVFGVNPADGTATPSIVYDQNPNMHLITTARTDVTFNQPANGGYSGGLTSDNAITGFEPFASPRAAGQAGCTTTSCLIDTGDGRFVYASTQQGNDLWNVATYGFGGTNGSFATPYWGQFNTAGDTTTQFGALVTDGCSDDFNASLVASADNHVWANYTSTDPQGSGCGQTFVRQMEGTRLPSDGAGTMTLANVFTSSFELTNNFDSNFGDQRFGDMSSIGRDPGNVSQAWSWNEEVTSTNGTQANNEWGTRAEAIKNS